MEYEKIYFTILTIYFTWFILSIAIGCKYSNQIIDISIPWVKAYRTVSCCFHITAFISTIIMVLSIIWDF